jgi:hypothetical protein
LLVIGALTVFTFARKPIGGGEGSAMLSARAA